MNSRKYKLKNNNGGSQPNSVFGGEGKVALDGGTFKSGSPAPGGVGIVGTAGTAGSGLEDSGDSDREGGGTLGRGDDRSGSLTRRTMGKMTVKELQELKRSEDKRRSDKKKEEKRKKRRKKDDGSGDASDSRDNTLTRETIGKDNNGAELSDEEEEDNRVKEGNTVNSLSSADAPPVSGVADDNIPSEGGDENGGESNKAFEEVTDNIKPESPPVVSAVEEQEPVVSVNNTETSSREIIEQPPEQPTPPVTAVDNTNTTTTAASTPATDKHSAKAGEEEEEEEKANNADDDDDDDDDDDAVFEDARDSGPVGNVLNVPPKEEKQRNSSVTFAPEPETLNPEDEKKKISVTFEDETKPEKKKEKRKSFLKRRESSKKEKEKEEKKKKEKEKKNSKKDKKKSSKKKKGDEILLDSETEKTEESELDTCKSNDDDDKEDLKDELALEKAKLIEKAQVAIETDEGEITGENEKTEGKKNKKEKKKERKSKKSKKKKKGKDSNEPAADQLIIVGLEDSCIIPRKERPEEKKVDIVQLREDEEKEDQKLFEKFKRREKSRKRNEKIKECCKKFAAFLFSHIGLCGLVVGYSIMGGFVFKALEAPFEYTTKLDIRNHRDDYVKELWTIAVRLSGNSGFEEISSKRDNFTTKVNDVLKRFQELLFDATKNKGWDGKDAVEGEEPELQWSYAGALLYAVTVITTIGYGHVAPKTAWGRLITILYALVGIPLTFLYLSNIGNFLADCFRVVYGKICCGLCCCYCKKHRNGRRRRLSRKANNESQNGDVGGEPATTVQYDVEENYVEEEEDDKEKITVPVSLCLVIITGYIIGGATLFTIWEQWDYLTGSYFCFITLSTIGFGDIVPGTNFSTWAAQEKLLLAALYVVFGLSLLAMCFNLMQEEVKEKCKRLGKKIGIVIERDSPKRDPERETQL